MTKTPRPTNNRWESFWNFPSDLTARAASYASRKRISLDHLPELAVSEFYITSPEPWRPALSTVAELAVGAHLAPLESFETSRQVSHAEQSTVKVKTRLPRNRWKLPAALHLRLAAYGSRWGIRYSELWHTALRHWLFNPLKPSSWQAALRTLVAEALNEYLEKRQPPRIAEADKTADEPRQH
jgi:hypothetical protein